MNGCVTFKVLCVHKFRTWDALYHTSIESTCSKYTECIGIQTFRIQLPRCDIQVYVSKSNKHAHHKKAYPGWIPSAPTTTTQKLQSTTRPLRCQKECVERIERYSTSETKTVSCHSKLIKTLGSVICCTRHLPYCRVLITRQTNIFCKRTRQAVRNIQPLWPLQRSFS